MVDLQGQAVVAVLTRAPSAGGKTRLFAEIGCAPDAAFLAALVLDTLDAVDVPGVTRAVCYTPPDAREEMRALLPPHIIVLPQRGGDLGVRMRGAFDDLFARGAASVVLIGSDVPALDPSVIIDAHRILRARPDVVVLGPANDGGYYLVGATQTPSPLFDQIQWSTADVLAQTESRAAAHHIHVERLAFAPDVDTLDDLRHLVRTNANATRTRRAATRLGVQ